MSKRTKCFIFLLLILFFADVSTLHAQWIENGTPVSSALGTQNNPQITTDGAGGAIITWEHRPFFGTDIYVRRIVAYGFNVWVPGGVAICTASYDQQVPQIISDGSGGAIITWQDNRHTSTVRDIYAQKINAGGNILWATNGVAICTATGYQSWPELVSDGAGGAIITWYDPRTGDVDIYAQRIDASGNVLWTTDGVAICSATGDQSMPQITSDGAGGAIVTWMDNRSEWDTYAQRIDSNGSVQWTANGIAICTDTLWQQNPQIISDGAGGAVITWHDHRNGFGNRDIYAQRISAGGSAYWTAGGVAICTATNDQAYPQIASDGSGGAIITWEDVRDGSSYDIYTQRVNASGNVQWTIDGVALAIDPEIQSMPQITSDGAGGAIVTWHDTRDGHQDVYAQKVNAGGTIQWAANGLAVCSDPSVQREYQIISDDAGGAIVTWHDRRTGDGGDIYALKVDQDGNAPPTGVNETAPAFSLAQNFPNPFNPYTRINYTITESSYVTLGIYDVSGHLVKILFEGKRAAGRYGELWDGRDDSGRPVTSGVYFYRLEAGSFIETRKMVLLR